MSEKEQLVRPDAPVLPADQVNPPTTDNVTPSPPAAAAPAEEGAEGEKKPSKKGGELLLIDSSITSHMAWTPRQRADEQPKRPKSSLKSWPSKL